MSNSKELINSLYEFNTNIKELNEIIYSIAGKIDNGYDNISEFRNLIDNHPKLIPVIEIYSTDTILNYITGVKALNEILTSMIDYGNNNISDHEYKSIVENATREINKCNNNINDIESSLQERATQNAIEQFVAIESVLNDF